MVLFVDAAVDNVVVRSFVIWVLLGCVATVSLEFVMTEPICCVVVDVDVVVVVVVIVVVVVVVSFVVLVLV